MAVRRRLASPDRKRCVQKQHTLTAPFFQIPLPAHFYSEIRLDFLENVFQAWRRSHSVRHGKGKAVRLARPVIRVLAYNHDLYRVHRSVFEGIEYVPAFGINDNALLLFGMEKRGELPKIRFFELILQGLAPTRFYPDIHLAENQFSNIYFITSSILST